MPRKAKELSPLEVRRPVLPGRCSVGGVDGLVLQVTGSGARSWILRFTVAGKQREMGLGNFPSVTLAEAREKARAHRAKVDQGADPIAARRAARSAAGAVWTIPATRMKAGGEHRVPLSMSAAKVLRSLSPGKPDERVFPGLRGPLSDMSLTAVLRRMNVEATAHGFRSTFRDWVSEHTNHASEVAEMALAHAVGDKVEAAYRRGNLFEKRVLLMSDWAAFLDGDSSSQHAQRKG